MPAKPKHRAPRRPHRIVVEVRNTRVTWWYRGPWRGVSLPKWEVCRRVDGVLVVVTTGGLLMPNVPSVSAGLCGAASGEWGDKLPHLSGWLCDAAYPDKTAIGQVQLQLKRDGSVLRATLKVADQAGLRVQSVGETPWDALVSLDLLLGSPSCPWERDPFPLGGAPGGSKKK